MSEVFLLKAETSSLSSRANWLNSVSEVEFVLFSVEFVLLSVEVISSVDSIGAFSSFLSLSSMPESFLFIFSDDSSPAFDTKIKENPN